MDKLEAGKGIGLESILVVRVELIESEPEIWRQLEIRDSLTLDQVHQVLQTASGWEDAHLHRFTADYPFAAGQRRNSGNPAVASPAGVRRTGRQARGGFLA
ncbi:plasmid pRiA4b ORF-3 family protein [Pseudarthrobacter sp. NamE2]|uniref:plasmid pRiA4b ORF-3 family protein n=1 Tax=Pseudarthrobacter sp. NamE2 TaxID=2576838 RepID=UPI0021037810|nr:plasmid pRiA4b ORF-3 family protein [Pseudarthrobacter sp. NamE2]